MQKMTDQSENRYTLTPFCANFVIREKNLYTVISFDRMIALELYISGMLICWYYFSMYAMYLQISVLFSAGLITTLKWPLLGQRST